MSPTYSVSVRLQRVTTESAHVSIPLTEEMWIPDPENPKGLRIDTDKLMASAIQYGRLSATSWKPDGDIVVKPHPLQTPPDYV